MRRSIQSLISVLSCSVLLAACGGGGGGGSKEPALTFTPATATATYTAGTSVLINLTAHVTDPDDFNGADPLYVVVEDASSVLNSGVDLNFVSEKEVAVTLHTSSAKAAGHYTGTFNVHLCKDVQCSKEYPGAPVPLPYDITVM